ncbi:MAG: hypothetical protein J0I93_04585 [Legionella sp.]|nr:hypothetical protein [Legionella sp.]
MIRDIYDLLRIKRTDNFRLVKQEFFRQLESLNQGSNHQSLAIEIKVFIEELTQAWKKVDTERKLVHYFQNNFYLLEFPDDEDYWLGEEIRLVYVPIVVKENENGQEKDCFYLNPIQKATVFDKNFNFNLLAQIVSYKCRRIPLFVGITAAEAERIHQLYHPAELGLIIELAVMPQQLSSERYCIQDILPGTEANFNAYFCLKKGSSFAEHEILSVCPIDSIMDTQQKHYFHRFWPKVGRKFVMLNNLNAATPDEIHPSLKKNLFPVNLDQNEGILRIQSILEKLKSKTLICSPGKVDEQEELLQNKAFYMSKLCNDLDEEIKLFIRDLSVATVSQEELSGALVYLKADINERLNEFESMMQKDSKTDVLPNLFLALTGVGLFALIPKLLYTYCIKGKAEGFFTNSSDLDDLYVLRHSLNHLSLEQFLVTNQMHSSVRTHPPNETG